MSSTPEDPYPSFAPITSAAPYEHVSPREQARCTAHAMDASRLDLQDVWFRYFAVTGNLGVFEVDAYFNGLTMLNPLDRDLVSHAVNELILENQPPTAPFSTDSEENSTEKATKTSVRRGVPEAG